MRTIEMRMASATTMAKMIQAMAAMLMGCGDAELHASDAKIAAQLGQVCGNQQAEEH